MVMIQHGFSWVFMVFDFQMKTTKNPSHLSNDKLGTGVSKLKKLEHFLIANPMSNHDQPWS